MPPVTVTGKNNARRITVLGAGAWGTALALYLARQGQSVTLAPRRPEQAAAMQAAGENREYLPGLPLGEILEVTADAGEAIAGAEFLVLACPAAGLQSWCERIRIALGGDSLNQRTLVTLTKGLDPVSLQMPVDVVAAAGDAPMTVEFALRRPVPEAVLRELGAVVP